MRKSLCLLALVAILAACSAEAGPDVGTPVVDPLLAPLAQAAESGRSVLVMYTKEGCGCCDGMEKDVIADAEVKETLEKMVFVRVTKDKDAESFEAKWKDAKAPAFVVLGPDGEARGEVLNGPFEAGDFLFLLDWVIEADGPQPTLARVEGGCAGTCSDKEDESQAAADEGCGGCGEKDETEPGAAEGCGGCSEDDNEAPEEPTEGDADGCGG